MDRELYRAIDELTMAQESLKPEGTKWFEVIAECQTRILAEAR